MPSNLLFTNDVQGQHAPSYYAATAIGDRDRPSLAGDHKVDVCVIGGGFTGLSTAFHLAEKGYSVILLDAHRAGWGASGRNGGQAAATPRVDQETLEEMVGKELARQLQTSVGRRLVVISQITRFFVAGDPRVKFIRLSLVVITRVEIGY